MKRCIRGFKDQEISLDIVYVDSNSSDDSVAFANSEGLTVINLDMSIPFSAGRARNEGFRALLAKNPHLEYVQFADGDTVVADGWLNAACDWLTEHPQDGIVWGSRRELFPEKTIYNAACDLEWNNTPPGYTDACGGDFMARSDALSQVAGFNPSVVAGEEPELCFRLREAGWKIYRLDHPMTWHDAAITDFSQAWQRQVRAGHAYLHVASLHFNAPERFHVRESIRPWFWGFGIPVITLLGTLVSPWSLLILFIYPLQVLRLWRYERGRGVDGPLALYMAAFNTFGKFAELQGHLRFIRNRLTGALPTIIEYK